MASFSSKHSSASWQQDSLHTQVLRSEGAGTDVAVVVVSIQVISYPQLRSSAAVNLMDDRSQGVVENAHSLSEPDCIQGKPFPLRHEYIHGYHKHQTKAFKTPLRLTCQSDSGMPLSAVPSSTVIVCIRKRLAHALKPTTLNTCTSSKHPR